MEITEITIFPIKPTDKGLIGLASCTIDDKLSINSIGIFTRLNGEGLRIAYPTKQLPNGKVVNCVYPINADTGKAIEKAIIEKCNELSEKVLKKSEEETKCQKVKIS